MAPVLPKKKNNTNALRKSNASSKLGGSSSSAGIKTGGMSRRRTTVKGGRSADTVNRLQLYKSKPLRNKKGTIIGGQYIMNNRAGDTEITNATGRIQPDRRWFGNTRVVDPTDLDHFRSSMIEQSSDPYSVVLKRKKLPMGLLKEATSYKSSMSKKALLEQEPFAQTFSKTKQRKRVKLEQYLIVRKDHPDEPKNSKISSSGGEAVRMPEYETSKTITITTTSTTATTGTGSTSSNNNNDPYKALLHTAQQSNTTYEDLNTREGLVQWGRDLQIHSTVKGASEHNNNTDWRYEKKDDLFLKGQSKRIWGEFFKVIDCSDVILHIIDARNVPGTRCTMIEHHVQQHASHKHLIFVLNKIDLVPNWVAKRWMGELAKIRPTIAFHASLTHAFGKGALISLLRQFGKLHNDKKQISVGVVGYPNTGKSSVINCLTSKKSCKVAPIPGETKIWQYVTLFKRIALIDCPGVVVDTAGDTEEDSVLKGVVRAERLQNPEDFIDVILQKVKHEHIAAQYKLPRDGEDTWSTSEELMDMIARRSGRLLKGGEPCLRSAAISIINDYQRGRLPHYVAPPNLKDEVEGKMQETEPITEKVMGLPQDLDKIGYEHMAGVDEYVSHECDDAFNKDDPDDTGGRCEDDHVKKETSAGSPVDLVLEDLIAAGEWED